MIQIFQDGSEKIHTLNLSDPAASQGESQLLCNKTDKAPNTLHAGTYGCRAVSDGDAGCGGPQCSGGSVIVPEADLGLSWEKEHTRKEI